MQWRDFRVTLYNVNFGDWGGGVEGGGISVCGGEGGQAWGRDRGKSG